MGDGSGLKKGPAAQPPAAPVSGVNGLENSVSNLSLGAGANNYDDTTTHNGTLGRNAGAAGDRPSAGHMGRPADMSFAISGKACVKSS